MQREVKSSNIFQEPVNLAGRYHRCLARGSKLLSHAPGSVCVNSVKAKPSTGERLLNFAKCLDTRSQG